MDDFSQSHGKWAMRPVAPMAREDAYIGFFKLKFFFFFIFLSPMRLERPAAGPC
jgi:hypothetical protein